MSPYEKAMSVYQAEPCKRTFAQDLDLHLRYGFVFSTPEFFVMGRPVRKDAIERDLVDPGVLFKKSDCDAWMLYLVAGDMAKIVSVMPYPLPWIILERKNEVRIYPLPEMVRLASHIAA